MIRKGGLSAPEQRHADAHSSEAKSEVSRAAPAPGDRAPEGQEPCSLSEVVREITNAGQDSERIAVREILDSVGRRSFGPLLLVPGLVVLSPLSGIPGLPTVGGLVVLIIAGQMLVGRQRFWLPQFILRRSISRSGMSKAGRFLMPVARFVDRLVRRRWQLLTTGPFRRLAALMCIVLALMIPPLETLPFANSMTAAAISAFGLALAVHDGVLALAAFLITGGVGYLLYTALF